MKEISYRCDICKQEKEKDEIIPYFVNMDDTIRIMEDIDTEKANHHICRSCIGIIYTYQKKEIKRGFMKKESIK